MDQLEDNLKSIDLRFSGEELEQLNKANTRVAPQEPSGMDRLRVYREQIAKRKAPTVNCQLSTAFAKTSS